MEINEIMAIILLLLFIIGAFLIISSISGVSATYINNVMCQQSATVRSMVNGFFSGALKAAISVVSTNIFTVIPLVCHTNEIIIDENSRLDPNIAIANEIAACWEKFGSGTKDPLYPDTSYLCSKVIFRSNNPEKYVDLMKIYSILYFNKSMMREDEYIIPGLYEESEDLAAETKEEGKYYFDFNAFRFCSSGNNQIALNNKLLDGINIGEEDLLARKLIGTGAQQLSADSKDAISFSYSQQVLNGLINLLPGVNIISTNTIPACLSLKESALNSWKININYLAIWKESCQKICADSCEDIICIDSCAAECKTLNAKFSEKMAAIAPVSNSFEKSTIFYDGIFYIKFFDFSHWLLDASNSLLKFEETSNIIYPVDPDLFGIEAATNKLSAAFGSNEKLHDYVIIGYEPDSSGQFVAEAYYTRISAGVYHSCGVLSNGSAVCWGKGTDGRLGNGDTFSSSSAVVVSGGYGFKEISAYGHSCGVLTDGKAVCWGKGTDGQLGNGDNKDSLVPVVVSGNYDFLSIDIGNVHSCGVLTDGKAVCWGKGTDGQLGNGDNKDSLVPVVVSGGYSFKEISAGYRHSCGVLTDGRAVCWGLGDDWRLGSGDNKNSFVPVFVSGNYDFTSIDVGNIHSCGVLSNGSAVCWGKGTDGILGNGENEDSLVPVFIKGNYDFSLISAGAEHSCGVLADGRAVCWGNGGSGRLGNGETSTSFVPVVVSGNYGFILVSAGAEHSCGVLTNGSAVCWGKGLDGRLGNGGIGASSIPVFAK